ncbi:lipopolysaccharide transport periplasmic protein LptA [Ectothiorhodospira shaposhnikovii]|uniref:lipopolysaccharide transport periplasmic protein LptA n=1 Tax=Ectothiorhodospira shaposhnikovii TaxID=1054 RepID=UPI001EE9AE0C|nr:lipopolysaccharide transport periplasmic protein LptA [Ectothiorhodospira shaposhnikovii]MCG5513405.1 lipopolysaccharide transport periplasmic protein LptA [Ectothiorhodospira shaposhnikovii]
MIPALAILLPAGPLQAQVDRTLPIRIEADSATLDDNRGISTYRGSVRITQGATEISGDTVTVHTPGRVLERMTAEGQPATLRTQDPQGREVRAEAARMEFLPNEQRMELSGNARVRQGTDEFRGSRITYDLRTATLEARTGDTGRVEAIFTPREQPPAPVEGTP